ncbi:MAG: trimethyllysine dioxygenase [Gammaproteobacteria bacterium]|nr:trimethyllysine dioxygenase [Gammaproteobacteria bacterium]
MRLEQGDTGLLVWFAGQTAPVLFSWFWLRDHGLDESSIDPVTLQRRTDTFSIAPDIRGQLTNFDQQQQLISLLWPDGQQTSLSAYLLASNCGLAPARHELAPDKPQILWDNAAPLTDLPAAQHAAVMQNDSELLNWLEQIFQYGFSVLEGVPSTEQATTELAQRVGRIQETLFGTMWPLSSELTEHGDTAYSTSYLAPHTDGTYYQDAAGLQMFNCLRFDGDGGENILVDGYALAEQLRSADPEAFQALSEINVPSHYIERGVHMRAERPAFRLDGNGDVIQVSFNNYDRAPMRLVADQADRFHRAYRVLHDATLDESNWVKIGLRPGQTLIFDNWRLLHGRMGYVGERVFYGCYHSRAEFESRLRVLRASIQKDARPDD